MKTAEIRSLFLDYFKRQGHTIVESSSIIPQNDPTLLFTNAGMVQFKDVFLGKDPRPYTRAATVQKCVRAGGKHNDLENVGFTARHHTFFEMLGNFSFGDYFKKDAIKYAWQFITQELKLPKDRLYVSVFEKDDEAAEIWNKQEGVPLDRISRFGEKDNFWSMGDTGPCGPCTEIFVDRGEKYSCGKPTCKMGCDCDRYMEFWNLVFMQYDRSADGKLTPLPKPSVDTGAGLERIAMILQEVDSNYDADGFALIISKLEELSGMKYDPKGELAFAFRAVADHSRATAFLIGDGVMPSNEGRGYVLRRIMRRAIRLGQKLGFKTAFMYKTTSFVIDQMKDAYPELLDKRVFIEKAVLAEEEQFLKTLDRGLTLLEEERAKLGGAKTLPGEVAFKLYDTFGFPLDLTRVICTEHGLNVDEAGFAKAMERQRAESRKNWKGSGQEALDSVYLKLSAELKAKAQLPKFVGYERLSATAPVLAILHAKEGVIKKVESYTTTADEEPVLEVVFAETPFYGESGGQMGDHGLISGDGFEGEVIDVQKPVADLIVAHIKPKRGTLKMGGKYEQQTDTEIRALTARNHTATHLLHWALREVLGKHVKQAGSLVASDLLRFDFAHFQGLHPDELKKIEDMINEKIWRADKVLKREMGKEAAVAAGAIAFFGEKYGDLVRVISVGDFSTELCGGTHVDNSADIHIFKIISEQGIAAGVRRIIAMTSKGAFEYMRYRTHELEKIRDRIKANSVDDILPILDRQTEHERTLRKQIEQFQAKAAAGEAFALLDKAQSYGSLKFVASLVTADTQGVKKLRDLAEALKAKDAHAVVILGMNDGGKAALLVACGAEAQKKIGAGDILKGVIALVDGRGGGKPDMAQGGGTKVEGLEAALKAASELVKAKG